ncbi:MAG: hypothetical protein ACRD8W_32770 [Nitrososphaeraceae archaeon]
MNAEETKTLLKDRGVSIVNMPHGYIVTVSRREGTPSLRIEMGFHALANVSVRLLTSQE